MTPGLWQSVLPGEKLKAVCCCSGQDCTDNFRKRCFAHGSVSRKSSGTFCWSLLLQVLSLNLLQQVCLPQTLSLQTPSHESTWNFRVKAAGVRLEAHSQKYDSTLHCILSTIFSYLAWSPQADFAASAYSFFFFFFCTCLSQKIKSDEYFCLN